MLDLKYIRENRAEVERAARLKSVETDLEALLGLDGERRRLIAENEALRRERNLVSEEINRARKAGEEGRDKIERMRLVSARVKEIEASLREIGKELGSLLAGLPNIPAPGVPEGPADSANLEVRSRGEKRGFSFSPRPHHEIAENLGLIDFRAGGRMSGSFFVVYTGWGARLERALIGFMLDFHRRRGYTEISPPFLVNRESMFTTGQLPKLEQDMYRVESEDLFLIPTAEVPVTNLHREEILDPGRLPLKYVAYTPCFRLEAGAYGKDTRGLQRLHQFDKVELVKFCRPEESEAGHESLVEDAEAVLEALGLHYRVVLLGTGDLSFAASKCYDLEAWAPAQGRYLEVSSCSNFESFQARRGNIRFRGPNGPELVHTLNGSGVALARTLAAILENYQREDGSVEIPAVLRPYLDGETAIGPSP